MPRGRRPARAPGGPPPTHRAAVGRASDAGLERVRAALDDDLDTPAALAALDDEARRRTSGVGPGRRAARRYPVGPGGSWHEPWSACAWNVRPDAQGPPTSEEGRPWQPSPSGFPMARPRSSTRGTTAARPRRVHRPPPGQGGRGRHLDGVEVDLDTPLRDGTQVSDHHRRLRCGPRACSATPPPTSWPRPSCGCGPGPTTPSAR